LIIAATLSFGDHSARHSHELNDAAALFAPDLWISSELEQKRSFLWRIGPITAAA
jgi:hypothetical protein